MDGSARNYHRRPRASVVLSMLGALAGTFLWLVTVVAMAVFAIRRDFDNLYGWTLYAIGVVVAVPFLWRWWRELLRPEVWPERPETLDEAPREHRGLHGQDPPPTRW